MCDTVGHSTPAGVRNLVTYVKDAVADLGITDRVRMFRPGFSYPMPEQRIRARRRLHAQHRPAVFHLQECDAIGLLKRFAAFADTTDA